MATLIDSGTVGILVPLASFIFIFVILYAILQKTKLFGGKSFVDGIVSIMITILVALNDKAIELANLFSIWSVVIIVIFVFILLMFFMWVKEGDDYLGLPEPLQKTLPQLLFWAFIIILIIGLTHVFGPVFTPYSEDAPQSWVVLRTLFHPRVIGALVILLIVGNFAKYLAKEE